MFGFLQTSSSLSDGVRWELTGMVQWVMEMGREDDDGTTKK